MSINGDRPRPASSTALETAPQQVITPGGQQQRVGRGFLTLFGFLNFGLYLTVMMPAMFSLPHKVALLDPTGKALTLGLVATVGAVASIIAGPAAGILSDRTRTRWGRRPPWLLGGIVVAAGGSIVVAASPNVPALILGWVIVCVGGAGAAAAITPIVAERVPEQQRGSVGAIVGVATQIAGVLGYTLGSFLTWNLLVLFALPWILLAVISVVWVLTFPDVNADVSHSSLRSAFKQMVFNPRKHPDFSWVWLGKLFMQITLAFLSTYQLYFLGDRLGFTPEEAGARLGLVGGLGILITMTFAIGSGLLSDKLKRRKPFILTSAILAAIGMSLMAYTDGFGLFLAAVLTIMGSAGMFGAVDVALASDLVPDRSQAGRWMSTYNVAATLSTAIAPLMGSVLLMVGTDDGTNYTALFLVGAMFALTTGAITFKIRGVR